MTSSRVTGAKTRFWAGAAGHVRVHQMSDYQEGGAIIHLTHSGLSNPDHILDFDTTDHSIDMEAVI